MNKQLKIRVNNNQIRIGYIQITNFQLFFVPGTNAEPHRITLAAAVFEPITKSFPRAPTIQTSPSRGCPGRNPRFACGDRHRRAGNYGVILFLHALRVNLYQALGTGRNKVSHRSYWNSRSLFRASRKSAPRTLWIALVCATAIRPSPRKTRALPLFFPPSSP